MWSRATPSCASGPMRSSNARKPGCPMLYSIDMTILVKLHIDIDAQELLLDCSVDGVVGCDIYGGVPGNVREVALNSMIHVFSHTWR